MSRRQATTIRNSERITLTTCPQKWWWAYVERLRSPDVSPALRFGTLVHSAMEVFYRPGVERGPRPAETFERLFEEQQKTMYSQGIYDEDGEWHELGQLGVVLLEAYFDHYGLDERWHVIATEMPFRVRTFDAESGVKFTFVGVVDGLWGDRETANKIARMKKYVTDHKTTKDDPTKKDDALALDEQSGSYWSYGVEYFTQQGLLNPNDDRLAGMIFNFLRKGKPDLRPKDRNGFSLNRPSKDALWDRAVTLGLDQRHRLKSKSGVTVDELIDLIGSSAIQLGEPSQKQPTPLFHRARSMRGPGEERSVRARTEAQAYRMNLMRRGKLRIEKTPGTLHNPHCNWCEFKAMCELHESGADWEGYRDVAFGTWDPYQQHEIKNAEQV